MSHDFKVGDRVICVYPSTEGPAYDGVGEVTWSCPAENTVEAVWPSGSGGMFMGYMLKHAAPEPPSYKQHDTGDDYSAWHDYSNPGESSKTNVHEDQDPDRPTGSSTTKDPKRVVKWFKDRK